MLWTSVELKSHLLVSLNNFDKHFKTRVPSPSYSYGGPSLLLLKPLPILALYRFVFYTSNCVRQQSNCGCIIISGTCKSWSCLPNWSNYVKHFKGEIKKLKRTTPPHRWEVTNNHYHKNEWSLLGPILFLLYHQNLANWLLQLNFRCSKVSRYLLIGVVSYRCRLGLA